MAEGETEAKEVMVECLAMEGSKQAEIFNADEELELAASNQKSGVPLQPPPAPVKRGLKETNEQ